MKKKTTLIKEEADIIEKLNKQVSKLKNKCIEWENQYLNEKRKNLKLQIENTHLKEQNKTESHEERLKRLKGEN